MEFREIKDKINKETYELMVKASRKYKPGRPGILLLNEYFKPYKNE